MMRETQVRDEHAKGKKGRKNSARDRNRHRAHEVLEFHMQTAGPVSQTRPAAYARQMPCPFLSRKRAQFGLKVGRDRRLAHPAHRLLHVPQALVPCATGIATCQVRHY
jgi:hypothetical protein